MLQNAYNIIITPPGVKELLCHPDVMIEFWCFAFNCSSARCSIRQINVCLFVSLTMVRQKPKTGQDASVWGTEGLVLTDVGTAEKQWL